MDHDGRVRRAIESSRRVEEQVVLDTLHSERFQDQSPRQVYAELLDEGKYVGSPSTMYRILAAHGESSERRNQREARSHAVPRLEATAPNQVWTWDISKLATYASGVFLNLYLVLDLFSRFPVAWMIAERENSALSKQLFAEAITRYRLEPGSITVHNDRGAPMTSGAFIDLLAQLGVERSVSRPRVSNDNPYSESCFKTIKYQPDYPGRFHDAAHARRWFTEFFEWYANRHRHSGLALFTPADVFFGRVAGLADHSPACSRRGLRRPSRALRARASRRAPAARQGGHQPHRPGCTEPDRRRRSERRHEPCSRPSTSRCHHRPQSYCRAYSTPEPTCTLSAHR